MTNPIDATFGFADLAGFTALTEAHGDSEAVPCWTGSRPSPPTPSAPTIDWSRPSATPS